MALENIMQFLLVKCNKLLKLYLNNWPSTLHGIKVAGILIFVLLIIELLFIGWPESSIKRLISFRPAVRSDILTAILAISQLMPILSIFVSFGLFYFLTKSFKELFGGRINLSTENTIAMTVSYYVLVDFLSYWGHRIFHAVPCLWVLHKYHHSAPEMNMLNKYRTHPMYEATASVMSLPLIFLGASPEPIVAFNLLILAHTLLLHSNFKSNWGWFGKWVVFSPAAHRLHHSTSEAHFGKNLGSLLPIWDHMFGTAMHPTDHESHNIKIGLSDDPGDAPSFHYIWTVYKEFFINIYGQLVSRLCGKTT